jgi:formylglycine-generating enzyme required for sulfatase activity
MKRDDFIPIPAGPFLFGADYAQAAPWLVERDRALSLGLGAVLANTPARWIDLPAFAIQARMVTNGDYHEFWTAAHPEKPGRRLVDDSELWKFVWDLHGLGSVRVPGNDADGALVEQYADCRDAVDALAMSYAYECQRLLVGHHIPPTDAGFDTRSRAVVRVFAVLRKGLAQAMEAEPVLTPGQASVAAGADAAAVLDDLGEVLSGCEERLRGTARVPLMIILRRLRRLIEAGPDLVVRPSDLFQPLLWPDNVEKALKEGGGMFKQKVPFADLPVMGVSLYEASGFAAWARLSLGEDITLPSEAEWEKAFGWDAAGSGLDPARKHLFPWQARHQGDFNQFFSREGERVEQLHAKLAGWKKLMEETARDLPGGRLHQGLGFGWQWTREPFNELERKYNRFSHAAWPRRNEGGVTIHRWCDAADRAARAYTVRGAPDQLGGPGTVTRRFALSPLRGYAECGFRCVIATPEAV